MPEKYNVASVDELSEPGSRIITEVDGVEIAVFNVDGEFHAIANYCVHQAGPLCEGELTGKTAIAEDGWNWIIEDKDRVVECPWHSWKFDVTTGKSVDTDMYSTPVFEVEVRDDEIYVLR